MIELIAVLSFLLHKYADLAVALALLAVNAGLSFLQEQRAFWTSRPSGPLIAVLTADACVGAGIDLHGLAALTPLPLGQRACLAGYACACSLIQRRCEGNPHHTLAEHLVDGEQGHMSERRHEVTFVGGEDHSCVV
jgi:hypothetical protein